MSTEKLIFMFRHGPDHKKTGLVKKMAGLPNEELSSAIQQVRGHYYASKDPKDKDHISKLFTILTDERRDRQNRGEEI